LVIPPPAADTVRVKVPSMAVAPAASVKVRLPLPGAAMLVDEKLAVTPAGTPLTDKPMGELNSAPPAVVTVIGTEPPRATLALVVPNENVNVGRTVSFRVCDLATPPPDAARVSVEEPAAAVDAAESDKMALPAPGEAMLCGEMLPLTPAGSPVIDSQIAELKPFTLAVVKVTLVEPPGARLTVVALGVRVKLAGGKTVRLKGRTLSVPPPTAPSVRL